MSHKTVAELCSELDKIEVPVAKVNQIEEVFEDPQVLAQAGIISTEHPTGGDMKIANTPWKFQDQDQLPQRHAASHGEHSEEILSELNVSREEIDRILAREEANRAMLQGFTLEQAR